MRSALTRHVFKQLLCNEPLSHARCLRLTQPTLSNNDSKTQRRSFLFGFGRSKSTPKLKPVSIDPGISVFTTLRSMLKQRTRPPPREEVIEAFKNFFQHKKYGSAQGERSATVLDTQAELILIAFKYLQETGNNGRSELSAEDLKLALKTLSNEVSPKTKGDHLALAELIYIELAEQKELNESEDGDSIFETSVLRSYLRTLVLSGKGLEAVALLDESWEAQPEKLQNTKLWPDLLGAFAQRGGDDILQDVVAKMKQNGVQLTGQMHASILAGFRRADNIDAAKRWFQCPLLGGERIWWQAKMTIIRMCVKHNELTFGDSIVQSIIEHPEDGVVPSKPEWQMIFAWAAMTGHSPEAIDRMFGVMRDRHSSAGREPIELDARILNSLIEVAVQKNNGYLAERFIQLGHVHNIKPNAETRRLQMDYRLKHDDLDGALGAWQDLMTYPPDQATVSLGNRLILTLAQEQRLRLDTLMGVVTEFIDHHWKFEPATVAALCRLHMKRNELHDAIDLIHTHANHYSAEERDMVRDNIVELCLEPDSSIPEAWDAYIMVHELFSETPRNTRETIMAQFFSRNRPDLAMHVFGHMRQSPLPERRPDIHTYRKCFEGIAKSNAEPSITDTVYNMLKLDSEVDPDTRLNNALMMALTSSGRWKNALDIWDGIAFSREGPTYDSIRIALMACEANPFGQTKSADIMKRLNDLGVELTPEIYLSHIWTIASFGDLDKVREMITRLEDDFGMKADATALGILYNVSPGVDKKKEIKAWAAKQFPAAWGKLESKGMKETGQLVQYMIYNIDRGITP